MQKAIPLPLANTDSMIEIAVLYNCHFTHIQTEAECTLVVRTIPISWTSSSPPYYTNEQSAFDLDEVNIN